MKYMHITDTLLLHLSPVTSAASDTLAHVLSERQLHRQSVPRRLCSWWWILMERLLRHLPANQSMCASMAVTARVPNNPKDGRTNDASAAQSPRSHNSCMA